MLSINRVFSDRLPDLCWSYDMTPVPTLSNSWGPSMLWNRLPFEYRLNDLIRYNRITQVYGEPPSETMPFTGNTLERQVLLSNVREMVSDWNFHQKTFAVQGENQVHHASLRGDVEIDVDSLWSNINYSGYTSIEAQQYEGGIRYVGTGDYITRSPVPSLSEGLNILRANRFGSFTGSSLFHDQWYNEIRYCPEVEFLCTPYGCAMKFCYYGIYQDNGMHSCHVVLSSFKFRKIASVEECNVSVPLSQIFDATMHVNMASSGAFWPGTTNPVYSGIPQALYNSMPLEIIDHNLGQNQYYTISPTFVFKPEPRPTLEEDVVGYRSGKFYSVSLPDVSFSRFQTIHRNLAPDILAMSGYALPDVLDQSISSFGVNQLENVEGISALFGLVDVKELFARAVKLRHGGIGILREMLDLLADSRLVYSYALSPTKNDITSIVGGAKDFKHRWLDSNDFTSSPLRGKTRYHLPDSLVDEFKGTVLDVSLKIVGCYNPDNFLPVLLPLDAVGVLPRFSRFWATLPFSFVFDNILNVSNALSLAETMATLPFVYEAKYTIFSTTFSFEFDSNSQIISDRVDPFSGSVQYRIFDRWVLPRLPFISPSRIAEPLLASRLPSDWTTYGALAYRVLL